MSEDDSNSATLYFGYGSNLWLQQMTERCPKSTFVGIACLRNYRWMISARGSANLVQVQPATDIEDEVWGMVYALTESDEARLDKNEGVPHAHTKEIHEIDFWSIDTGKGEAHIDISAVPEKRSMLLYIDQEGTTDDKPREEYIYRMNMGIVNALKVGIPCSYVAKVLRRFIPESSGPVDGRLLEEVARKKAGGALA